MPASGNDPRRASHIVAGWKSITSSASKPGSWATLSSNSQAGPLSPAIIRRLARRHLARADGYFRTQHSAVFSASPHAPSSSWRSTISSSNSASCAARSAALARHSRRSVDDRLATSMSAYSTHARAAPDGSSHRSAINFRNAGVDPAAAAAHDSGLTNRSFARQPVAASCRARSTFSASAALPPVMHALVRSMSCPSSVSLLSAASPNARTQGTSVSPRTSESADNCTPTKHPSMTRSRFRMRPSWQRPRNAQARTQRLSAPRKERCRAMRAWMPAPQGGVSNMINHPSLAAQSATGLARGAGLTGVAFGALSETGSNSSTGVARSGGRPGRGGVESSTSTGRARFGFTRIALGWGGVLAAVLAGGGVTGTLAGGGAPRPRPPFWG